MQSMLKCIITAASLSMLAPGAARAVTNEWVDDSGTYGGDYTNTAHWSLGTAPASTEIVWFDNSQTTPYTVQFTRSWTNDAVTIKNDKIVFDVNGYIWRSHAVSTNPNNWAGGSAGSIEDMNHWFSVPAGQTSTVTFTSSQAPQVTGGNTFDFGWNTVRFLVFGVGATVNIESNVIIRTPYGFHNRGVLNINGGELNGPNAGLEAGGTILVNNGGTINAAGVTVGGRYTDAGGSGRINFMTVTSNSTLKATGGLAVGWAFRGAVLHLLSNSTAHVGGIISIGDQQIWNGPGDNSYLGTMLVDDATVYGQSMVIGGGGAENGKVTIQNGGTVILSNGYLFVDSNYHTISGVNYTNTLVLNNGTIVLGKTGTNGALTNRGIMRTAGTIRGNGAGPALIRNERSLEIGSGIGTLVLSNANLELALGSQTLFEFSETGLDQIVLNGGSASILGSNLYTIVGNTPTPGVKWGLGAYDFVVGDSITWNPQYDEITNVLAGYSLVQGLDYNFGLVNLGNGLQALRLEFVPEPSTALLLLGGGLLLWKVRRRRG